MPVRILDQIKQQNNADFPVAEDIDIKGGITCVSTTGDRDAIPASRRKAGMLVSTSNTGTIWSLGLDLTTWSNVSERITAGYYGGDLSGTVDIAQLKFLQGNPVLPPGPITAGQTSIVQQVVAVRPTSFLKNYTAVGFISNGSGDAQYLMYGSATPDALQRARNTLRLGYQGLYGAYTGYSILGESANDSVLGNWWVQTSGGILQIDTSNEFVLVNVPLPSTQAGGISGSIVATSALVWAVGNAPALTLYSVDPTTRTITAIVLNADITAYDGLFYTGGSYLWLAGTFTSLTGAHGIVRVDPSSGAFVGSPVATSTGSAVVAGAYDSTHGKMYLSVQTAVDRVDATTGTRDATMVIPGDVSSVQRLVVTSNPYFGFVGQKVVVIAADLTSSNRTKLFYIDTGTLTVHATTDYATSGVTNFSDIVDTGSLLFLLEPTRDVLHTIDTSGVHSQISVAAYQAVATTIGGGGGFTAGGDLTGTSTSQQVALISAATGNFTWAAATTTPTLTQATLAGTGANAGQDLQIRAQAGQNQAGAPNNNGGHLVLVTGAAGTGGTVAGADGAIKLYSGVVSTANSLGQIDNAGSYFHIASSSAAFGFNLDATAMAGGQILLTSGSIGSIIVTTPEIDIRDGGGTIVATWLLSSSGATSLTWGVNTTVTIGQTTTTGLNGNDLTIKGQGAGTNGGNIILAGGTGSTPGSIILRAGATVYGNHYFTSGYWIMQPDPTNTAGISMDATASAAGQVLISGGSTGYVQLQAGTVKFAIAGTVYLSMGTFNGSSAGVLQVGNVTTAPTTNPTGAGLIYASSGALLYRGSSGTVTTLAPA